MPLTGEKVVFESDTLLPLYTDDYDDMLAVNNGEQADDNRNGLNPITLKENCIQSMLKHCVTSSLPSLFFSCVDFISWNPTVRYDCNLKLPCTMNTIRHVVELQCIQYIDESLENRIELVTLYDHIKVNTAAKKYWFADANKRNDTVPLKKVTD